MLAIGTLYTHSGKTEFPRISPTRGNAGLKEEVVRYRWNGSSWATEIIQGPRLIGGGGKC